MPLGLLQVSSPLTMPQSFRKIPILYFTLTQILDTSIVLALSSSASLSFQNTDLGAIENLTLSIGYGILGWGRSTVHCPKRLGYIIISHDCKLSTTTSTTTEHTSLLTIPGGTTNGHSC